MKYILLSILLLIINTSNALSGEHESVYDRVMESQTIRCGYALWPPYMSMDVNTGQLSGIMYDYVETLGKNLGLKIEWAEEMGWGDYIAALENNRIDVYCPGTSWNAERARLADFTNPMYFMKSAIFVKQGNSQFDNNLSALNHEDITLTIVEGDIFNKISNLEFPKSKKLDLPQLATPADLFLSVADGKADATITEAMAGLNFMKERSGRIQMVKLEKPFRSIPIALSIKGGEYRFQRMLDIASYEMLINCLFDSSLTKYDPKDELFLKVATPFK